MSLNRGAVAQKPKIELLLCGFCFSATVDDLLLWLRSSPQIPYEGQAGDVVIPRRLHN